MNRAVEWFANDEHCREIIGILTFGRRSQNPYGQTSKDRLRFAPSRSRHGGKISN
jgi:hypothetical protein